MAFHLTPEQHNANPPSTWVVVKVRDGLWHLRQAGEENPIARYTTKREAEAARLSGRYVDLYEREGRWFAGEPVQGWKPYRPQPVPK